MMQDIQPGSESEKRYKKYYKALEPMIASPKNRIYTTVVFSFLAISLFAWYAIKPTIQTILYLRKEIADKTILNEQMEQKIANLIEIQNMYEQAQSKLHTLDEAIPKNPELLDFALQMRNLTDQTEASLAAIHMGGAPLIIDKTSINSVKGKEENPSISVSNTTVGGYTSLEKVLTNILSMRRILTFDTITFSEPKESVSVRSDTAPMQMTLQGKTYYSPDVIKK